MVQATSSSLSPMLAPLGRIGGFGTHGVTLEASGSPTGTPSVKLWN